MLKEQIANALWNIKGRKVPAEGIIKRLILKEYARTHSIRIFVETGTFMGDTIAAMRDYFDELHSIELSKKLYKKASERFANDPKVTLWQGDSGVIMPKILKNIQSPTLFWLDAHGSGGLTAQGKEWSPVMKEVQVISKQKQKHIILIDDARGFTGHLSPTIDAIHKLINKNHPKNTFTVKDDIIRVELL